MGIPLHQLLRADHRNMAARQVTALLAGGTIRHRSQQIAAHTGVVEQGVALGGRAIPQHTPASLLLRQ